VGRRIPGSAVFAGREKRERHQEKMSFCSEPSSRDHVKGAADRGVSAEKKRNCSSMFFQGEGGVRARKASPRCPWLVKA